MVNSQVLQGQPNLLCARVPTATPAHQRKMSLEKTLAKQETAIDDVRIAQLSECQFLSEQEVIELAAKCKVHWLSAPRMDFLNNTACFVCNLAGDWAFHVHLDYILFQQCPCRRANSFVVPVLFSSVFAVKQAAK